MSESLAELQDDLRAIADAGDDGRSLNLTTAETPVGVVNATRVLRVRAALLIARLSGGDPLGTLDAFLAERGGELGARPARRPGRGARIGRRAVVSWWDETLGVDVDAVLTAGRPGPTVAQERAARFEEVIEEVVERGEVLDEPIDGGQAEYLRAWAAQERERAEEAAQPSAWEVPSPNSAWATAAPSWRSCAALTTALDTDRQRRREASRVRREEHERAASADRARVEAHAAAGADRDAVRRRALAAAKEAVAEAERDEARALGAMRRAAAGVFAGTAGEGEVAVAEGELAEVRVRLERARAAVEQLAPFVR